MKIRTIIIVVLVVLAVFLFAGWATGFFNIQSSTDSIVNGELISTEMAALPADAKAVVQLRDVTETDAPVLVLDEQILQDPVRFPVAFELQYRSGAIDESHVYGIVAQIIDGDQNLIYATAEPSPVITHDRAEANISVLLHPLDDQ